MKTLERGAPVYTSSERTQRRLARRERRDCALAVLMLAVLAGVWLDAMYRGGDSLLAWVLRAV